jgi:amino acid transporter
VSARTDRLRAWFPVPFVAIVVLMLALIALTPNLVSNGRPSAGSLQTEAELLVDYPAGQNVTHLYVKGIGTVDYATITLALARPPPGSPPALARFTFNATTQWNDSILAGETTALDPVAVNVTAVYTDPTGTTVDFVGEYEFNVTAGYLYWVSYLPSPSSIASAPLSALPITFPLTSVTPSGGSP